MTSRLIDQAVDLRLDWLCAGLVVAGFLAGLAQAAMLAPPEFDTPIMVDLAPLPPAAVSLSALPEPAPQKAAAAQPSPPRAITPPKPKAAPIADQAAKPEPQPAPEPEPTAKPKPRPAPQSAPETEPEPEPEPQAAAKPVEQAQNAAAPRVAKQAGAQVSPKTWARQVTRQIRATPKHRAGKRGRATVGFSVADDGSLSSVAIIASSGDPELDALALDHIRRAAPFPPPPSDANRNLGFEFVAR